MLRKKILFSNFSRALFSQSSCIRPNTVKQLEDYLNPQEPLLVRGSGLSYNDSCFNTDGLVINSKYFNHLISWDPKTGIVVCQGGVSFSDLFLLDPDFIPPVLPGTLHATVAGGVAHDVHGKNNHQSSSFCHHIIWIELLIANKKIHCSREIHSELFYATIGGLGLTGIITQLALRLRKASHFVTVTHKKFESLKGLTQAMTTYGLDNEYQVAWIDLLNAYPRSILSLANHCESATIKKRKPRTIPKVPFCIIRTWNMKLFNRLFFTLHKNKEQLHLQHFNNPLDKIRNWNRLYGPEGLIQFQAVFHADNAAETLEELIYLIKLHHATPTLCVLKLLTKSGEGLLSFCKPGFTLAIDFVHNHQAKQAITAMNQLITQKNGRIYLAKDWLLDGEQYKKMYENHHQFSQIIKHYECNMHSDLAKRLGIIK